MNIVLTGAPCSGKSEVISFVSRYSNLSNLYFPEMGTFAMQMNMHNVTSKGKFQKFLYDVQLFMEKEILNIIDSNAHILFDRGSVDSCVFNQDPFVLQDVDYAIEFKRYDVVYLLGLPKNKETYESLFDSNPNRIESYAEAVRLDGALREAWSGHPSFHIIEFQESLDIKANLFIKHLYECHGLRLLS